MPFDYRQIDPAWNPSRPMALAGRVAFVPIEGTFQFGGSEWMTEMLGGVSTAAFASLLTRLASMDAIDAVVLEINSGGGSSQGVTDIAGAFVALRKSGKKVYAIAHDIAASLAMLPLALADEAVATPSAILGYMGTRTSGPVIDQSKKLATDGIATFMPAYPAGKAQGNGVEPFSDEFRAAELAVSESVCRPYLELIARGRGLTVESLVAFNAMGITPQAALSAGLVNRIEPFPTFLSRVLASHNGPAAPDLTLEPDMPTDAPLPTFTSAAQLRSAYPALVAEIEATPAAPAPFAELRSKFGQDPGFIVECQEKGYTVSDALEAYSNRLAAKVAELTAANTDLAAKVAELGKGSGGVVASGSAPGTTTASTPGAPDPATFDEATRLCMADAGNVVARAQVLASRRFPALGSQWVKSGFPSLAT